MSRKPWTINHYVMSPQATEDYKLAQAEVQRQLNAGEIKAYSTGHNNQVGRYIQVESHQGWDPHYFWQEFHPEAYHGDHHGQDLYL